MVDVNSGATPQFHDHLLQSATEGIVVFDQQGTVTATNRAAAEVFGYEPGELIGQAFHAFWPEDLAHPMEMAAGETYRSYVDSLSRDQRMMPVTISVGTVSTGSADQRLVFISNTDGVERLNEALSQMQRLAGIGALTASVAHELNTPISVITATCTNLLREADGQSLNTEDLRRYVEMIEQSAWRCARIVGVLRNYSTEESLQIAVTDLNLIIEDAISLVRHQFVNDWNVEIEVKLAPELKSLACDHNRVTQVIINLLTNARDAMHPDGGTIRVTSWSVKETDRSPNAAADRRTAGKEEFAFSVSDSGRGLSTEAKHRMYAPFFSTKSDGKGIGLGLFVAKRIVTQHGGRIWGENNADSGATFTVVLPRSQASAYR